MKKVRNSASFGVFKWGYNENETKLLSKLAKFFDSISVRVDSFVQLCNDYLKVNLEHLVDPAKLLRKDKYIS